MGQAATGPSRLKAGIWREMQPLRRGIIDVEKVRAHTREVLTPSSPEEWRARLNQEADRLAKRGRGQHDLWEAAQKQHETERRRLSRIVVEMARCLAAWPPQRAWSWAPRVCRLAKKTAPQRAIFAKAASAHSFLRVQGTERPFWRCTVCLRGTRSLHGELFAAPCGEVAPSVARLGVWAEQHQLRAAVVDAGPEVVLFCTRCGAYMCAQPKRLAGPCGEPVLSRVRTLGRVEAGKHPDPHSHAVVGPSWPVPKVQREPEGELAGQSL